MSETTSTEDTTSSSRDESSDEPTPKPLPKKDYPKGYDLQLAVQNTDTKARVMSEVPEPRANIPSDAEFWVSKDVPNIPYIQEHLRFEGKFDSEHLIRLFELVYDLYSSEANIVYVNSPATICGDIHGQFYDLLKLFEVGGDPSGRNYIFLGDYVDRGDFSIECLILLFSFKVARPDAFFMIRGNHECRHLTDHFTFKEECLKKYNLEVYDTLMDVFDSMPLAAIMNDQFFCVHGGISPEISTLEDIMQIERFMEPPSTGPFCDLLWSDPHESFDKEKETKYVSNQARGVSYNYGYTAVKEFLVKNNLLAVIRGHECQKNGFRMYKKRKSSQFPILITLFSAPNYAAHYNNKGAVMCYEDGAMTIKQFTDSPFPYSLPSYQNVLAWSIPFVAGKINELMMGFFNLINDAEAEEEEKEKAEMQRKLKQKIMAVGRMASVFANMKDEREKSLLFNGLTSSNGEAPQILQGKTSEEIKEVLALEEGVRQVDAANEAMPMKSDKVETGKTKSRLVDQAVNPEIVAARRTNSMNMSSSPTGSPNTSDFLIKKSTIPKISFIHTT
jgi:serine/threonine-protein phosphatase 2B catalytic subunit